MEITTLADLVLAISQEQQLQVIAEMSDNTTQDVTTRTTFTSANPAVAEVSAAGAVKGIAEGTTYITLVVDGKQVTVRVDVTPVTGINVSISRGHGSNPHPDKVYQVTVPVGHSKQLYVWADIWNGETQEAVSGILFESANPLVASVDANGLVTGITAGNTVIRVIYKSATGIVNIKVPGNN